MKAKLNISCKFGLTYLLNLILKHIFVLRLILYYQQNNKDKLTLLLLFNFVSLLLTHTTTKSLNQQLNRTITNFNCQTPTHLFQRYTHAIITWYCTFKFGKPFEQIYTNINLKCFIYHPSGTQSIFCYIFNILHSCLALDNKLNLKL